MSSSTLLQIVVMFEQSTASLAYPDVFIAKALLSLFVFLMEA